MKVFAITTILTILFFSGVNAFSATTISAGDYELVADETGTLEISITNDVAFTAFQFDAIIPEHFTLVNGSVMLAGRENGHDFSWELLPGNVLRVIAYSIGEAAFFGTFGPVVQFSVKAGTKPGIYPLNLQSVIIASNGVNILDEIVQGNLTLRAPEVTLTPEMIDFGEVPLLQQTQNTITIQNTGNSSLTVTGMEVTHPDYSLNETSGFVLAANSSVSRTITFYATEKGLKSGEVKVYSDCPANPVSAINLSTDAFAVNEMHLGNATGRSGYYVTLPVSINNMESFTGFQFEINLPDPIQYVPGSEQLSGRKTDHQISADTVQGKLIVTAWSPTNASFAGAEGEIATIGFFLEGNGGYYYLNFSEAIIANKQATNIISASYGNNIRITAPSISLSTGSYDFGRVSVIDSLDYTFNIHNYGDDTLNIQSIVSTESSFTVSDESYPIVTLPSQSNTISVKFKNQTEGEYSGRLIIRNNDVNNDPIYLDLQGETFEPNELQVVNGTGILGELNYLEINLENYTDISAFQFDLKLPEGFSIVSDSCSLTERSDGHSLGISNISGNIIRFISYSGSLKTYTGNSGTILKIGLVTEQDVSLGVYNIQLQNVILSDITSRNVVSAFSDGQFELLNCKVYETDAATICQGEEYLFGTQILTTAGEYSEMFQAVDGCDSIVTLHLTVNPIYNLTVEAAICEGGAYVLGTQTLTTAGEYTEVFQAVNGCDSTVTLTLTVNPVYNQTIEAAICEGETYQFGARTLASSGEYSETYESISGCDSIVLLTLEVYQSYELSVIDTLYNGDTLVFGDQDLTEAGEYNHTFQSVDGCDSIIHLTLVESIDTSTGLHLDARFSLGQNYPNPFTGTTTIPFELKADVDEVMLKIFDLTGREVQSWQIKNVSQDLHFVEWEGENKPGVYIYRMYIRQKGEISYVISRSMVIN